MFSLPFFSPETWALILLALSLLMLYGNAPYGIFKKLGIPGPKPYPFLGTFLEYRKGMHNFDEECFKKYGRIWGTYDGRQPILAIMDPAMIKTILVKECYSVFTNRRDFGLNGPLSDAVSVVVDDDWRRIRGALSPSFTSGRLKEMFKIMTQHSTNLITSLRKKMEKDETVDIKEFFGPYSMDVVTSTAFSVDIDSMNQPNDPFVTNIKKMLKFSFFNPLLVIITLFPFMSPLFDKLELSFFPKSVLDFFYNFLKKVKEDRSKNAHNNRVDFMQLMVDSQIQENGEVSAEGQSVKGLTDHEVLSQAMIFIFAGYETSSSTLSYVAYHLAIHPDTMRKLQKEIDETFPDKSPVTYEKLMQMEYLDMVINETMRLYPLGGRIERICKKTVEINGVTIPKGMAVAVPLYPLHRDPELWPEPETFNPERFSKENHENIDPYTFLPFGAGPRNCIGMRFAMLAMKLALVETLQNFTLVPCEETEIPLELDISGFMTPKNPIKLKLAPRIPAGSEE
ncbi:cytochrome P450 3A40 isoform X2 [Chanos chanos]|uniref:Cytochrome P450 3A n=1 Tax=Chanos chanos TaxID=29144 RepID=A0A6J2WMQ7_CHACN|nr:cytochrome P450 3A40-like isoform X2 [Chanos chanos]